MGVAGGAAFAWWRPRNGAANEAAHPASDALCVAQTGAAPPSLSFRRVSDHFVSEYDSATRNPRWVAERLTRGNLAGDTQRGGARFREEAALPPHLRPRLSDYLHSGYDRGHLAPAGDQHSGKAAMDDSFYLSNISPQVGAGFNRDYWARLEAFVRGLTTASNGVEDVLVVTGPLFLPSWKPPKPS